MANFKKIAKRTALVAVKVVEVFYRIYLYVFHPALGALVALALAGVTKRTYYEWLDRIVLDFTRWSEDKISEWDENSENTL